MNTEESNKPALFEGRQIRKAFHEGEWWFSIIDVVEVLVGGDRPRKYWNDLKKKLTVEGYVEVSEKIGQLKMVSPDGKRRTGELGFLFPASPNHALQACKEPVQDSQSDQNHQP